MEGIKPEFPRVQLNNKPMVTGVETMNSNGIESQLSMTDSEVLETQQRQNEEFRRINEELQSDNARLMTLNVNMQERLKFIDDCLPEELSLPNIQVVIQNAKEQERLAIRSVFVLGEKQKDYAKRSEAKFNEAQERFEEILDARAECLRVVKEDGVTLQKSLMRVEEKLTEVVAERDELLLMNDHVLECIENFKAALMNDSEKGTKRKVEKKFKENVANKTKKAK